MSLLFLRTLATFPPKKHDILYNENITMYFITSRRILNHRVRLNDPVKGIFEALSRVGCRCQSNHPQRPGTLCFEIVGLIGHQVVYEHCLAMENILMTIAAYFNRS
jgi:hypothetical protein